MKKRPGPEAHLYGPEEYTFGQDQKMEVMKKLEEQGQRDSQEFQRLYKSISTDTTKFVKNM